MSNMLYVEHGDGQAEFIMQLSSPLFTIGRCKTQHLPLVLCLRLAGVLRCLTLSILSRRRIEKEFVDASSKPGISKEIIIADSSLQYSLMICNSFVSSKGALKPLKVDPDYSLVDVGYSGALMLNIQFGQELVSILGMSLRHLSLYFRYGLHKSTVSHLKLCVLK